ncbi:MAG: hypothetical protein AAF552_18025 [Pseudomonadota bacterium]
MAELYAFLLYAMAAVVAVVVIAQGLSRSVELFSARNIYLAGFIVYQLFSPAGVLMRDSTVKFQVKDIDAAGLIAVGYAAVFLVVYFLAYRFPGPWRGVAGWLKTKNTTATDASLLIVGFTLVMLGLGMRLAQFIPYIRSIAFHTGVGLAAVSCVFVGWVVARRYSNILVLVGSAVIFIAAVGLALDRSYGRRPLVGVCLGLMWGIYFSLGNRLKPKTLLLWLAPLSLAALLIVSSFTAVRGRIGEMTFTQVVQEMVSSKRTLEHAAAIFDGQLCGEATLWCIEAYPKKVDQQHILSLRQMVLQVIPRSIWPEKPEPLVNTVRSSSSSSPSRPERAATTASSEPFARASIRPRCDRLARVSVTSATSSEWKESCWMMLSRSSSTEASPRLIRSAIRLMFNMNAMCQ